jgi:hypothetical protein
LSPCCCNMHRIIVIGILFETIPKSLYWNYSLHHTWWDYRVSKMYTKMSLQAQNKK